MKSKGCQIESIEKNRTNVKKKQKNNIFPCYKTWGHTNNVQDLVQFNVDLYLQEFMKQNINYTSPTSMVELTSALSQYFEYQILSDLKRRKFTLFLDEIT